ncbi:MAG: hypothetical protein PHI71_11280, partial [Acidiphilium sp.]|nr:hypothetical protein [Acidiphilium sp.]
VVQIIDDLPFADIGKNVGFPRRYIYMLRDKYRSVLKEIGSGVNRDAKTLFEYYWMPTSIHRRPKKTTVLLISRSSTQQNMPTLL